MTADIFVDSNVFLRFFAIDDAGQHKKAVNLFARASRGEITLVTGPPVLFEIAWTLRSAYRQPASKVLDILSALTALPSLRLLDAPLVRMAIAMARKSGQEFADAYIAANAHAAADGHIATFNKKHFDKLDAALWDL